MSASERSAICTNQSILKKEIKACEKRTINANSPIPCTVAGKNLLECFPWAASINPPKNDGNASPTKLDKNRKNKAAMNLPRYGRTYDKSLETFFKVCLVSLALGSSSPCL